MNIDPTKKVLEQEEQQHQHQSKVTEPKTTAVLALLISPSSPSSTSTVSPTASSISKNSSTDEVDETTAEAEPQPEKCLQTAVERDADEHQLTEHRRTEDDGTKCPKRQEEHYQRSSTQTPTGIDASHASMTLATSVGSGLLEAKETTLLVQCTPELVATELRTIPMSVTVATIADGDDDRSAKVDGNDEIDIIQNDTLCLLTAPTVHELTAEALSSQIPQTLSSSSSSSSTTSTPSIGEERRLPVVPEERMHPEDALADDCSCAQVVVAANNNTAFKDDLAPANGAGGCINDRYNNNKKRNDSDSDSQIAADGTQDAKVSDNNEDSGAKTTSTRDCCTLVLEEGVRTSIAILEPEIAPAQGGERSDIETTTITTETVSSEGNATRSVVAPLQIVQTLPTETTTTHDQTKTVKQQQQQGDIITIAAVDATMADKRDDDEGDASTVMAASSWTEESKPITSATGRIAGSSLASSPIAMFSSPPTSTTSSSSSSSSSSESTPKTLADIQQEQTIVLTNDGPQMAANGRPLCDCASKGQPLDDEGPGDTLQAQSSSPKMRAAARELTSDRNNDEYSGIDDHAQVVPSMRPLTLAEELSQAAAASSVPAPYTATTPSAAVKSPPPSTVVGVLPKSAADTAAAVVSSSNRNTSPVLHSSLKKPNKMGVTTGAAAALTSENRRRVSFPKDAQLITGYLDPVNPWACISICETPELLELYRSSCKRHNTMPINSILEHLQSIDVAKGRVPLLSLKDQHLTYGGCEALEEIFKHVQYRCIDLSHSGLDDVTASVMFDIIEYYEAANELDISDNLQMSSKTWTACINMIKKSQALNVLITRGPTISDYQATNLAKALNTSAIHTLKLEHCVLSQQPIASLCSMLKRNTVLRELWLAHNQLICEDAQQIANLLRTNFYIQLIDISNNRIGDKGVEHIVSAIVEQSIYFKDVQEKKRKSDLNFSDLSSSLNSINNTKNYFPQRLRSNDSIAMTPPGTELNPTPSAFTLTPPITPPSTPALPSDETPTEEMKNVNEKMDNTTTSVSFAREAATVYTTEQTYIDETNPPLLLLPLSSPTTPPMSSVVAPPNLNLVEMSTKNSVSLQTTSDREKPDTVVKPVLVTPEEEALILKSSSGGAPATRQAEIAGVEGGTLSTSCEIVQTDHQDSTEMHNECLELLLSLETHSGSPVPHAAKKARLAKQDSVLSEFEANISTAMETSGGVEMEEKQKHQSGGIHHTVPATIVEHPIIKKTTIPSVPNMMEEDVSELCADYDDDGSNLRISEENLFVDLGIPALCDEESSKMKDILEDPSGEVFAPLTPPLKKDELQLLIEKSQRNGEVQPDAAIEAQEQYTDSMQPGITMTSAEQSIGVGGRERKCAITSDECSESSLLKKERTQSSSSDSIVVGKGVQIVDVEIKDNVPVSRSLDSVGGDESDFESSSPFRTTAPSSFPNERSFSSESLNSETSIDSNDSKSSLKIHESKFAAKNGTLERQQSNINRDIHGTEQMSVNPSGLQVLVLWNNEITRNSARHFARLLEKTSTLDTLNVGSNLLCNSFVAGIGGSLKSNTSLTNLGLQGAHLSDKGAKTMAEIVEFGGNASLQRIDLRNNNIQKAGLEALNEAMKSNKSITRLDLDDTPRRVKDTSLDGVGSEYSRLVNNIRAQCERNKNPPEPNEPISASVRRARANYLSSRKISLTCQSIKTSPSALADKQHLLDPNGACKKAAGGRLRSPLPSPIPSPIASPVPSPSRNRFHVSRVTDSSGGAGGSISSPSPSSTGSSPTLFFPSNSRFRVVTVAEPDLSGSKSANNPHRSSSTISLPMGKSSNTSFTTSACGIGTIGTGTAIGRRPVCSSAPTFASFPSSPLSPLAAGVPNAVRPSVANQASLPPPHSSNISINTINTVTHPPSFVTGAMAPASTVVIPPLGSITNASLTLGLSQTLQQQQQTTSLPQQFVPMPNQQPTTYSFVTAFRSGNTASIPVQSTTPQVQRYSILAEQSPQAPFGVQQSVPPQFTPQYTPSFPSKIRQQSTEPPNQFQHSSSSSSTLHDSVLSSTSIESPDLEVKRFMSGGILLDDSCCSSISSNSIDSIDNANYNINTSISSTDESFDLIVSSPAPVNSAIKSVSFLGAMHLPTDSSGATGSNPSSLISSRLLEEESTLIPQEQSDSLLKVRPDAPASLSTSSIILLQQASSQESLYDLNDLSGSSNSSSMSAAPNLTSTARHVASATPECASKNATPRGGNSMLGATALSANNSNESTLTSVQILEKESNVKVTGEKAPRVRKTSWILGGGGGGPSSTGGIHKHTDSSSSGGSTPTPSGGSGYPPAIEKLLSIFHPSNLFSSNKASSSSASPPPNVAQDASAAQGGGSQPPSRKESPMGGLFYWAHGSSSGASANTSPTSVNTKKDEDRTMLKVNVSPETTLTPQQLQPLQNQAQVQSHLQSIALSQQQHSAEQLPAQLKVEMKENISPENTITNKLLLSSSVPPISVLTSSGPDTSSVSVAANPVPTAPSNIVNTVGAAPHAKVIFQLGGDYDESEDDIDTLTNKYGNHPSVVIAPATTTPSGMQYFGGNLSSGPDSLIGGSTTSNSSGISIGSGASANEITGIGSGTVASPALSTTSAQSSASDTVVVLSHLGQIARDSLSMFKNPSLTSQDSISIRSMDSLTEMAPDGTGTTENLRTSTVSSLSVQPTTLINVSSASEGTADRATTVQSALLVANVLPSSSSSACSLQMLPTSSTPLSDKQGTQ